MDVQGLRDVNEDTCRDACNKNSACTFYEYWKNRDCWLKKDLYNGPNGSTRPQPDNLNLCLKPGTHMSHNQRCCQLDYELQHVQAKTLLCTLRR
jgi:hypothetical protein